VEGSSISSVECKIPASASEEGRGTQQYFMTEICTTNIYVIIIRYTVYKT
jgi:hypothetical protein